ncbi:chitosanase [Streptomyces sp. NPDC058374]|uniref:chitosanase n=1 Tax=unclassified Streptomyces TaxID=2593676 RepID=UPI00364FAEBB
MKRVGCVVLALAPLATAAVFLLSPDPDAGRPPGESGSSASAAARGEGGAKGADDGDPDQADRETEERIARMPAGLAAPGKKEMALQLVASADNSTLKWRTLYGYIEDLEDGRGYTAGIAGFCTGTHDLLGLVERYTKDHPDNGLARYLPALREVDGSDSHEGLDPGFTEAWQAEAEVPAFRKAQERERDERYFEPAVRMAKIDGLGTLGQFIYYDAMLLHGPGKGADSFYGIRAAALEKAETKAAGGDERAYLDAFLDARRAVIREGKRFQRDTSRIDSAQRVFLRNGNLALSTPLTWEIYGESFRVEG